MTQEKANLINELMFLNNVQDELWRYHPNNPRKINVEVEYEDVKEKIQQLEADLKEMD